MIVEFSANNPKGIVDGVVVDLYFGDALGSAAWNPLLVAIIIHHNRRSRCNNGMLTENKTSKMHKL